MHIENPALSFQLKSTHQFSRFTPKSVCYTIKTQCWGWCQAFQWQQVIIPVSQNECNHSLLMLKCFKQCWICHFLAVIHVEDSRIHTCLQTSVVNVFFFFFFFCLKFLFLFFSVLHQRQFSKYCDCQLWRQRKWMLLEDNIWVMNVMLQKKSLINTEEKQEEAFFFFSD